MKNHKSEDCHHRKKPSKQKCILCRGQHVSDSVLCPVIRQVQEKIGIHFSRREKVVILKKEKKKGEKKNEKKPIPINSQNVWEKKPEQQQKKEQERRKTSKIEIDKSKKSIKTKKQEKRR
ncbi:hypothetical protein RFI_38801 [Reticulomyxa filosa]|uniref:Uncharacterized protein n=1 Tax=Reticulomyxa filosa TaxID=46433 RepID=X6LC21_RETFI|nr:hypothetical protein RFI_38801 [Reticulomyxa filosa]|eukprot:ETN98691.1 hypothetical protein RFI_38801 [Reticulomyxa filosa]